MRSFPVNDLVVLAALTAVMPLVAACNSDMPADTPTDAAPVPVRVCRAERRSLQPTLTLVGTIVAIPERSDTVSPRIGGWIQEVLITEGQSVDQGDVIMRLDCRVAEVNRDKARAALLEKEAILLRLQHGPRAEEIAAARAASQQAEAQARGLRQQRDAAAPLHARHEMSDVQYGKLVAGVQAAEAAARAAAAQLALLEAGTRPEEIAQAQAQVAAAKADLKDAELAVRFCTIESPIAGRVTQLVARAGMFAERAVVLATITDLSAVFASVRVPSAWHTQVVGPVTAEVTVSALPRQTFPGTLARCSGQADPNTGDVQAFVLVVNKDGLLHPGFACQVRFALPALPNALVVPVAAVADRSGVPVLTVVRDDKAYEIDVQLGVKTQEFVQVTSGLAPGDLVVTEGGYGLPAGCPVRIVPDTEPSSDNASRND